MSEQHRRPTLEMPREWRENLLRELRERESVPPPSVQKEIAEARGEHVEVCPLCRCGIVAEEVAALVTEFLATVERATEPPTETRLRCADDSSPADPFKVFDEE